MALEKTSYVVRFAGDSGDGIQLQGQQFTNAAALTGHDLATLPDFPAEIRAPTGTRYGVSAFQIQFGGNRITTPGDQPDLLIAFNPAALVVNISHLADGATVIVDTDSFSEQRLKRANLDSNPLEDGTLSNFNVISIEISTLTKAAVEPFGLGSKDSLRCKNFWALGLVLWIFDQTRQNATEWITSKFEKSQALKEANLAALNSGHAFGETAEIESGIKQYPTPLAKLESTEYRTLTGAEALALGLVAAGELADTEIMFCSYPITPASSILHHLTGLEDAGVATFQAEDEIAAVCAAIGSSYAGKLGVTSSSGPGIALKTEAIGLAVATELPLIIINSQRAGPSTGMPTKTEQSDLYQAVYGRNADSPLPVLAASSPADCFETAIEAVRIALRHMTPVILLTDGYIGNASELWALPDFDSYKPITNTKPKVTIKDTSLLFNRNSDTGARLWATPGRKDLVHRIGGIEKDFDTGNISYDAENHQKMTDLRAFKVNSVANYIPNQRTTVGSSSGLAVVSWGSTFGAVNQAVKDCTKNGYDVGQIHLRYLNPLPPNLKDLLKQYESVLVPELNNGQLASLLRDKLLVEVDQLNQVNGQPLMVSEVSETIRKLSQNKLNKKSG
tara:strand:+ start:234 stop:2090 length:1857 start_codon:yes stop_codon:yes gene_type:complete